MATPGITNELTVVKFTDFGIYLDGGDLGEILMPLKYVPKGTEVGDSVSCFVYYDSADRLIATTEKPLADVGQFAVLTCAEISKYGAFMNWGLLKDLLVPHREQRGTMSEGKRYIVYVYLDPVSKRIAGSTRFEKYLNKSKAEFEEGQEVDIMVARSTELGIICIINKTHTGLLYRNEVFKPLHIGDELKAYIKTVRGDGKIDLQLLKPGYDELKGEFNAVLDVIKQHNGYVAVTDKSDPEIIYSLFGMSKKNWKKIIGTLYKKKKIQLEENGIRLSYGDD